MGNLIAVHKMILLSGEESTYTERTKDTTHQLIQDVQ